MPFDPLCLSLALGLAVPLPVMDPAAIEAVATIRPALPGFDLGAVAGVPAKPAAAQGKPPILRLPVDSRFRGSGYTPPAQRWHDGEGGPVLEVGALGAARKGVPGIAHVSLDWNF